MALRSGLAAIALAVLAAGAASAQPADTARLEGVWKAERWFGPEARGRLVLRRLGDGYIAEIVGRRLPVREEAGELAFDYPAGGRFRGKLQPGGDILGRWYQPPTVSDGGITTPVRLKADASRRAWIGELTPVDDRFALYLMLQRRPDGSLAAVMRNPERDFGNQIGVQALAVRGERLELTGGRRGQPSRVLATGAYDPEQKTISLAFPGRGGVYEFSREGADSDLYPRRTASAAYAYRPPAALGDGWPVATLAEEAIDQAALERFVRGFVDEPMAPAGARQLHAVLIARHGRLVLEEYFHGQDPGRPHSTRSAGKSVTSVLIGAAMHAGAPLKLSSPVYQVMNDGAVPAGLGARKRAMTLEHLMTMSSGYYCDDTDDKAPGNEETMGDQEAEPDFYRYTLKVPMAYDPGQVAVYCSASPNLALGMLGKARGEDPLYDFERLVARPMSIERYGWSADPAGHPYGGGSVYLTPRDFLKFGQLMLDGGQWRGRRILDAGFVRDAVRPHYRLRKIGYGYLWWTIDYPYKGGTTPAFMALGAGGQTIVVVPRLSLVIAMMAGMYASSGIQDMGQALPAREILPAVREPGDDPKAPVQTVEFRTPYGAEPYPAIRVTPD